MFRATATVEGDISRMGTWEGHALKGLLLKEPQSTTDTKKESVSTDQEVVILNIYFWTPSYKIDSERAGASLWFL